MGTSIQGRVKRSIRPDSFVDITSAPLVVPEGIDSNGLLFDGDLGVGQVSAVWARMESADDADQTKRADLRAKRDAVVADPTPENVAALAVANANYVLGD